jgi:hypothetical protein
VRCQADKSAEYSKIMKQKMQWDPNAPYDYDFDRGLYYHHIIQDVLLCGSQLTCADDIQYLKEAEKVGTVLSVRPPTAHLQRQMPRITLQA